MFISYEADFLKENMRVVRGSSLGFERVLLFTHMHVVLSEKKAFSPRLERTPSSRGAVCL